MRIRLEKIRYLYFITVRFVPIQVVAQLVETPRHKPAGSNPEGVIGIFHWPDPSGLAVAVRSNQPLTEMSTRNISWNNGDRCVRLTTLSPSCACCLAILRASDTRIPTALSCIFCSMLTLNPCLIMLYP